MTTIYNDRQYTIVMVHNKEESNYLKGICFVFFFSLDSEEHTTMCQKKNRKNKNCEGNKKKNGDIMKCMTEGCFKKTDLRFV